jgi:glycosyltransferase involved in cell wall biosynthesis
VDPPARAFPEQALPPRVTVICIVYNGERFLREAIESVLGQSFRDFELIIVDDGSSDASGSIAREYGGDCARIFPVAHAGGANRGMSSSRNLGLAQARGEYLCFIDSDDVWRTDKLADQVRLLDAMPEVGMVCGRVNYWRSWAGGRDRLIPTGPRRGGIMRPPDTLIALYPLGRAHAPCPSDVMVRCGLARMAGGFEDAFTGMFEDQVFFSKLYLAAPVLFSGEVWLDYRQHPDSSVAEAFRSGSYATARRRFLDWLPSHLADCSGPERDRIETAIARARRDLDHPLLARIRRRIVGH